MQKTKQWGGSRQGAGRPHEHQEYLLIEVVDFYGDKDMIIAGPVLNRDGIPSKYVEYRARRIAAHHVNEQARSVKIIKRLCCSHEESETVEVIKESSTL